MSNIVLVLRTLLLSLCLLATGTFAALATGAAGDAADAAYKAVIESAVVPFDTIIQDANWRWEVVEERVKMGDTNLIDRLISEVLVHEANVRGTIEYETFFQVCNLADRLHYLSQDLYVKQFALMGLFGF
jgi:hypothetical protein